MISIMRRWVVTGVVCILVGLHPAWGQTESVNESPFEILIFYTITAEDGYSVDELEFVWFNYADGSERSHFLYTPTDGYTIADYEIIDERYLFVAEAISERAGYGFLGEYNLIRIDLLNGQRDQLYEVRNLISFDISEQGNYALLNYHSEDSTFIEWAQESNHCIVDWATQVCTEIDLPFTQEYYFWWDEYFARITYENEGGQQFLIRVDPTTLEEIAIPIPDALTVVYETFVLPTSYQPFLLERRDGASNLCYLWRTNDTQDALEEVGQVICESFEDASFEQNSVVLLNVARDTMFIVSLLTGQTTDIIPVPFNQNGLGFNRPRWANVELIDISPPTRTTLVISDLHSENGFRLLRAFYILQPTNVIQTFQRVYPLQQQPSNYVVPAD